MTIRIWPTLLMSQGVLKHTRIIHVLAGEHTRRPWF